MSLWIGKVPLTTGLFLSASARVHFTSQFGYDMGAGLVAERLTPCYYEPMSLPMPFGSRMSVALKYLVFVSMMWP